MKDIAKRLHRLEKRFGAEVESGETRSLRARIEAARRRCELQPISPKRLAEWRGMNIVAILNSGRQRTAMVQREFRKKGSPERDRAAS
jgi:hypothetical protein